MCEKNILTPSIEKNVCPLSMKRKCLLLFMKKECLPSIYDIIMDRGQILYFYPYHVLVLMEKCGQLNLNCTEVQWLNINEITRFIIFQLYINHISVWTCILILDGPQIKEPFYCIHRIHLYVGYYGLVIVRPQTFHHSQGNIKYPYWIASICYMNIDWSERITGKQDAPSHSRHPAPPPNIQTFKFFTLWPIYEKLLIIFSFVMDLSAIWWGLTALQIW